MRLLLPLVAACLLDLSVYAQRKNLGNECEDILTPNDPAGIMADLKNIKKKKQEQVQKQYEEALAKFPSNMFKVSIVGDGVVVIPHPLPPQIIDVTRPSGEQVEIAEATPPPFPERTTKPNPNKEDKLPTPPPKKEETLAPSTSKAPSKPVPITAERK